MHEKIFNMKKNDSSYEIYSHDYRFDLTSEDLIGSGAYNEVYRLKKYNVVFKLRVDKYTTHLYELLLKEIEQRKIYKNYTTKVYLYGIILHKAKPYSVYTIEERVYNYKDIIYRSLSVKKLFFNKVILFLANIQNNRLIYRDFKLENIGFRGKNVEEIVILDFDNITIFTKEELYSNLDIQKELEINKEQCNWMTTGTHAPLYIVKNSNSLHFLDKLPVQGVVHLILNLFFPNETNLRSKLENDQKNFSNLQPFIKNHAKLIDEITNLSTPKVQIFVDIMINMLSLNYEDIWKFNEIYEKIIEQIPEQKN